MSEYVTLMKEGGAPSGKIAVDDTILVKDCPALAGSKILEGFVPLFSADAVERLEKAGYEISGKTAVGEFGLDLMGENVSAGPADESALGAAASLAAKGEIKAALNVDLNGAPRRSAAVFGADFIKPTYGTVSRYGVIPVACSGEQIGVTAKTIDDLKEILTVIAGHDDKDGTSLPAAKYDYSADVPVKGMKVAVLSSLVDKADDDVKAAVADYCEKLKSEGAEIVNVSLDTETANAAWEILMAAECCNNLSRYDGVKFGYRTENYTDIDSLYVNTRTEGLTFLTKATILYGSYVLSMGHYEQCYDKALRIRRMIRNDLDEIFRTCQIMIAPACSSFSRPSYDKDDIFNAVFKESEFTSFASLTGIPAVVTKGVQLMSACLKDDVLLSVAGQIEKKVI